MALTSFRVCLVAELCLTLCKPMDRSPPGSSCPWGFSRQEYWSGLPCPPQGDLLNPQIEPRFPALQVDSLLSEPPGKPENTGVGCHALLQGIFSTQGLDPGLPHCRWILYHLSHQGSPIILLKQEKMTGMGKIRVYLLDCVCLFE